MKRRKVIPSNLPEKPFSGIFLNCTTPGITFDGRGTILVDVDGQRVFLHEVFWPQCIIDEAVERNVHGVVVKREDGQLYIDVDWVIDQLLKAEDGRGDDDDIVKWFRDSRDNALNYVKALSADEIKA